MSPAHPARTPRPSPSYLDECQKLPWNGESRWVDPTGKFVLTYDARHGGEIEAFHRKTGRHHAVLDILTGEPTKPAVKGRSINV
ncbi:colicin E3/pyocin S6 family cytotoxin [Brachybacterium paraconglomeratum]|uniref:colicin E3/pyocin S6 family cytotoxin n=1 Tax=Brachybacterium paraconglomeratum TaxID=173362 RepID=UPI003A4DADDB